MKKITLSKTKGFTLIELMITVAIVGILAAVAIPSYQDFVIRSQVSEGFTLAEAAQLAEAEYYANNGDFTDTGNLMGPISGKYVSAVYTAGFPPNDPNFGVRVSYNTPNTNQKIRSGGYVTFVPNIDAGGNIHWMCHGDGIYIVPKYLPSSCTFN